jgi:hypothetical protein
MPARATDYAVEGSTFAITVSFKDEDGSAVTPSAITWSLYNTSGAVVNSRQAVAVAAPSSTITIVLSGNDLALESESASSERRRLLVSATYNSDLGSGLTMADSFEFKVLNTNVIG